MKQNSKVKENKVQDRKVHTRAKKEYIRSDKGHSRAYQARQGTENVKVQRRTEQVGEHTYLDRHGSEKEKKVLRRK